MLDPRKRRLAALVVIGALLATVVAGTALSLTTGGDAPEAATDITVSWAGTEEQPSCLYDEASSTVYATLAVQGRAPQPDAVTVTVTAYADENTSEPVGSITETVPVEGTVQLPLVLTIDVEAPPHVGDDGGAACGIEVENAALA